MYLGAGWDDVNDKTGSPAVALMAGVAGEGWRPFDDGSGSIGARFRIRPQLTAEATFDGDVFVGAGLAFQLPVGSRSFVEASFQPGVQYLESDVFAPQFRSAIGIGFDLDSTTTLALIGNHKSNAKLGQDDSSSETGGTDHSWVARITPAAAKRGTCDSGH